MTISTLFIIFIYCAYEISKRWNEKERLKRKAIEALDKVNEIYIADSNKEEGLAEKRLYFKYQDEAIKAFNRRDYRKAISLAKRAFDVIEKGENDIGVPLQIGNELQRRNIFPDINTGVYLTNKNWSNFMNFFSNTNSKLDIMTNVISAKAVVPVLKMFIGRNVKIRIITRRILTEDFREIMELKKKYKIDLEIIRCARMHAKVYIRDDNKVIVGSPNFTYTSIGEEDKIGYVEGFYITDDKFIFECARSYFESIWKGEDVTTTNEQFLTSKKGGIPKKIIELIKDEKEELYIIMMNSLIQTSLIDDIYEKINPKLRIRIVTNWPKKANSDVKSTLSYLRYCSELHTREFEIEAKTPTIHAKIYIFKSKKAAFISSMNLHTNSWTTSFECGVLLRNTKYVEEIMNCADNLEDAEMIDIITDDNLGITLEESEEADRQAASLVPTKSIPFPLEGENWRHIFPNVFRRQIRRFKCKFRRLERITGASRKSHQKESEGGIRAGPATHLGYGLGVCRICKQRQVVNYPGSDGICNICKRKSV